jgi:4-diphosphocytidyl-2-C-methyl-D-erythritol kinase
MSGPCLTLAAPAKVNLFLQITGRRSDGYHELNTLMQKLALYDRLEICRSRVPGISLACPDSGLPTDDANIVYRAARFFFDHCGVSEGGVAITLEKNIPMAAGLGGGSSDAAAVLLGMNRLFAAGCSRRQLAEIGLLLGADVPFFVHDLPASWATGIGERLEPADPLENSFVLLVTPSIAVSTKWAYETFALTAGENIFNLTNSQKENYGKRPVFSPCRDAGDSCELYNDLERVTVTKYPEIEEIKQELLAGGAVAALMSGSGSTVFGLFRADRITEAEQCRQAFADRYEQVYLVEPLH